MIKRTWCIKGMWGEDGEIEKGKKPKRYPSVYLGHLVGVPFSETDTSVCVIISV